MAGLFLGVGDVCLSKAQFVSSGVLGAGGDVVLVVVGLACANLGSISARLAACCLWMGSATLEACFFFLFSARFAALVWVLRCFDHRCKAQAVL